GFAELSCPLTPNPTPPKRGRGGLLEPTLRLKSVDSAAEVESKGSDFEIFGDDRDCAEVTVKNLLGA
ncbi:MAG: hypothetical protein ACYC3I_00175, partial [Gemmataceae bacterium]